ncbi:MAG: ParA family protein [Janthinobacterium lividum]
MKIISTFNNKGGVGKSTLTFHLAHALSELGYRILLIDADPQCNLTLYGMEVEDLHAIWEKETDYIDKIGFEESRINDPNFENLLKETRTLHFLLKPTEEGTGEIVELPPLREIGNNVFLLPGRLSLHSYEEAIASRWSDAYVGNPLAIKTISRIRTLALEYSAKYNIDYVLVDTSPSIGILNKVIISTGDGLLIPCNADMFSLYGIRNIGGALGIWRKQFEVLRSLLSDEKKKTLPLTFVKFIGYALYNTKRVIKTPSINPLNIAQSNYHYAKSIPTTISEFIPSDLRSNLSGLQCSENIGGTSVIHSHNTLPGMAQKYKKPMWVLPSLELDHEDNTIKGNRGSYEATKNNYLAFARDFITRVSTL